MAAKKVLPPKEFKQKYYSPNGDYKTIVKKRYDMPETSKEKRTIKGLVNRAPKPVKGGAPLMKNEEPLRYAKKGGWIQGAIKRPGAFTAKAKAAGMSTSAYAKSVLKEGSKASTRTKRQANLAQTLGKMRKKK
jgi:hypothetical protein